MRLKHLALGLAIVTATPAAYTTAQAADGIFVPLFTYRTGPFAGSGISIANGMADYLNMSTRVTAASAASGSSFRNARPAMTPSRGSNATTL